MNQIETLRQKSRDLRFRGYRGTAIPLHRAIFQEKLSKTNLIWSLLLPVLFSLILLCLLPVILDVWRRIFTFWSDKLVPGATVSIQQIDLGHYYLSMHYPSLAAAHPSSLLWWGTLFGCVLTWVATIWISPKRLLPLTYIIRACILIQCTALAYFWCFPGQFPYGVTSYLGNALTMSLIFIFMLPWILGLTYFVFGFSLLQKATLTTLVLTYFVFAFPLQYMLHAYALHHFTLLFMPIFYLVFGTFLDVMMFVALYSWGMSWRWGKTAATT